jgi:hypothetical protein
VRAIYALAAAVVGLLIGQTGQRRREREAAVVGETVGRYVVERARLADEQAAEALKVARSSRRWAIVASAAGIGSLAATVLAAVV